MDFVIPVDHRMKIKESKKIDKYLDLVRVKNSGEHESDSDSNCSQRPWNGSQSPGTETSNHSKIRGRIKTTQTTVLLRSARILDT